MNWLQKLVSKVFGVRRYKPVTFDRPAKSVGFEAAGQKVVDEAKVNTPWEDAAETIRNNRMFGTIPPVAQKPATVQLRPIDVIGRLPPGTSVEQFLAMYKDLSQYDTVFIADMMWAWIDGKWVNMTGSPKGNVSKTVNRTNHCSRPMMSPARRDDRNDHDPLLDTLIITQAVSDNTSYRNSHSRQDSHRYEDSSPTHHHTPSHSHSHDHNRHDDNSGYDSNGSDNGGSSD